MSERVFVVIYHGYDGGDIAVEGVFTQRALAEEFVAAKSADYFKPEHYASQHYEVVGASLDGRPP